LSGEVNNDEKRSYPAPKLMFASYCATTALEQLLRSHTPVQLAVNRNQVAMSASSSNASAVPTSVYPTAPPFQAWKLSELPEEWKKSLNEPNTMFIAVELPDRPWGHAYHAWFASNFRVADFDEYAAVCVVNMKDYNNGNMQIERAAEVLRFLLETGKPAPHFLRILKQEEHADPAQQEMIVLPTTSQTTTANSVINSYIRSSAK
jgi:hypothetical protein